MSFAVSRQLSGSKAAKVRAIFFKKMIEYADNYGILSKKGDYYDLGTPNKYFRQS